MAAFQYSDLILVFTGLVCGLLIGLVAVGGVLMVPILHVAGGIPLRDAVAISMAGFLFTGLLAIATVSTRVIRGYALPTLITSCLVGAGFGAFVLGSIPSPYLSWVVAAVILLGVLDRLRQKGRPSNEIGTISRFSGGLFGVVAGFGSSISGTGGPLILMPLFSWQRLPLRSAISLAQALQLPIAGAATIVHFHEDTIPLFESLLATLGLLTGMAGGIFVSRRVPLPWLGHAVTVAMIVAGVVLVSQRFLTTNS